MINKHIMKNEFQREHLVKTFQEIELPPEGILVEWGNAEDKRTLLMNAKLWSHAYPPIRDKLCETSGLAITKNHVHAVAKDKFLDPILVPRPDGTFKRYPGSTAKLGKKKFSDFMEQVYAWGADMGVWFD